MKKLKKDPDLETELLSAVEEGSVDQVLSSLERGTGTLLQSIMIVDNLYTGKVMASFRILEIKVRIRFLESFSKIKGTR
jgi:hypothetical protein